MNPGINRNRGNGRPGGRNQTNYNAGNVRNGTQAKPNNQATKNQKPEAGSKEGTSERKQEIMANVALVLDQLHGEWATQTSKNE